MKKVIPQSSRSSLELLARNNPTLTGQEILDLQAYETACYNLWVKQRDARLITLVWYLKKQKYFKIEYKAPNKLVTYLNILNASVSNGVVYFDAIISKMSIHDGSTHIETLREEKYEQWDNFVTGNPDSEQLSPLTNKQYKAFLKAVKNLYNI